MKKCICVFVISMSFMLGVVAYPQETSDNTNAIDNSVLEADASISNSIEQQNQAGSFNTNTISTNTSMTNSVVQTDTNYYVRPILDKDFLEAEKLFFARKYYISRRAFLKYLEKNPLSTNDMLYFYLGTTYFIDKDYKNAIDYYKIASDLNDSTSYYNNIGNSYYQMKDYPQALYWYKKSEDKLYSPYSFNTVETISNRRIIKTNYTTNIALDDMSIYDNITSKYFNSGTTYTGGVVNEIINTNIIPTDNGNVSNDYINTNINTNMGLNNEASLTSNIDNAIVNGSGSVENEKIGKTFEEKIQGIRSITDRLNKIENQILFNQTNIFSSYISTNIVTNYQPYTNISLAFTQTTNTSKIPNFGADINITPAIYYSPYLQLGHSYLALKEYTNASIYYEVYLTNVGKDYYQFSEINKVINIIRNKDIEDILNPKSQEMDIITITNNDGSITVKDYSGQLFDSLGGIKESITTSFIDGSVSTFKKYGDGSTINIIQKNDGSILKETIFSSGKKDIENISTNGSLVRTSFSTDGTKHIYSTNANNEQYMYTEYIDGTSITKLSNAAEISTLIERSDGSLTKYTTDKKDNTIEIYTLNTDNSELQRIEYSDGKILIISKKPDGSSVNRTDNIDGSVLSISKQADGSVVVMTIDTEGKVSTKTTYVDGSSISRISTVDNMEKTILLTSTTRDKDGSIITRTIDENGNIKTITKKPDASIITEEALTDGTIIIQTQSPDGYISTKTNSPSGYIINIKNNQDGSTVVEEIFPDGSSKVENTDQDGNINTTIKNIGGSIDISIQNIDGTYEKNTTSKDGSSLFESLDKDGNTIKTITNKDMLGETTIETTIDKRDGSTINIKKMEGGSTTVINFSDGVIYTLIEQSGNKSVLSVKNSNIITSDDGLNTDDTIIEVPSDIVDREPIIEKLKEILDYRIIDENIIDIEIIDSVNNTDSVDSNDTSDTVDDIEENSEIEQIKDEELGN